MDSINKNQPEDNYENLSGEAAIEKIKALIEKSSTCFFCTNIKTNKSFDTRPMAVQKTDDEGNLWFLSASDSKKNTEITKDPNVQLLFQGSDYADFLSIYGKAEINTDQEIIKDLWKPILKTWFTEGEHDPRITVIKVIPSEGYYWDTKHNMAAGLIKRLLEQLLVKRWMILLKVRFVYKSYDFIRAMPLTS